MSGEDGDDEDFAEPVHGLFGGDADALHGAQGTGEGSALLAGVSGELEGEAAALAVVGFGQVDELEVEGEGAGEKQGAVEGQGVDELQRVGGVPGGGGGCAKVFGFTASNGALAELLHLGKQFVAGLLAQDFAEQHTQRTHITAQGSFFQLARLSLQFG